MEKKLGAIILAAGKGTRMNLTDVNKVTSLLGDKPMVSHIVSRLYGLGIDTVVIVVGFAKESVMSSLSEYDVLFAQQEEQLGTGHAVVCALKELPDKIQDVLVMNGDDSAFYDESTLTKLIDTHTKNNSAVTLLTIEKDNPFGLGRIIRDGNGSLVDIIEEKNATEEQKKIREVNPGCYLFKVSFLRENAGRIKKNEVTGEYYINNFIELAVSQGQLVETVKVNITWRGVNTPEELEEAKKLFTKVKE